MAASGGGLVVPRLIWYALAFGFAGKVQLKVGVSDVTVLPLAGADSVTAGGGRVPGVVNVHTTDGVLPALFTDVTDQK